MDLHAIQGITLFFFVVIVAFAALAQKLRLPYPILLVLAGTAVSLVPGVPQIRLDPDLFFNVFLPPLLFVAAWNTSWREFRANLIPIAMLALGLVAFTTIGVSVFAAFFIPALGWRAGLVLGAVVSTTDAIAATSIAKSIGLPRRIVDLLEGESLVNDATGLVAMEFSLMLLSHEHVSVSSGTLRLLWLIAGGIIMGLIVSAIVEWLERWLNDAALEMTLSLMIPYCAYLAAESIHASGVLAVVTSGLYLSRRSVKFFSPTTRIQIYSDWNTLNFLLNAVVFIFIGLQHKRVLVVLSSYGYHNLVLYGALFGISLIVLRLLWTYPGIHFAYWLRAHLTPNKPGVTEKLRPRELFIVGWTGMRGVVTLAAAFSLPYTLSDGTSFAQRDLIIFLAFLAIFLTLVLQGLTLPWVIRLLGVASGQSNKQEEFQARRVMIAAAVTFLESGQQTASLPSELHDYEDLLHIYEHRLEVMEEKCALVPIDDRLLTHQHRRGLFLATVDAEREALIRLRDESRVSDDIVRHLERELDLSVAGHI